MYGFFKNKLLVFIVTITLGIILAIFISNTKKENSKTIGNAFGVILMPAQKVVSSMNYSIKSFFEYFYNKKQLISENEMLKNKISAQEEINKDYLSMKNENDRFRLLLDFKQRDTNFKTIAAEVVAIEGTGFFKAFTIDKGTKDGILKKQAVITTDGLVGYISDIGTNFAKITTILDTESGVGAILSRTGDIAVVSGDALLQKQGLCKMTYLSKSSTAINGDVVETSGLGGMYKKGITIGKIKELMPDVHGISQYAVIYPSVNFNNIKEVFIIIN